MAEAGGARIREVRFEDHPAVESLLERVGLSGYAHDLWVHRWERNPLFRGSSAPLSQGWVLESGGSIVGYLGNIPHSCRFGEREFVAAATTAFAVLKGFRKHSLPLSMEFARQEGVDLLLSTTASPPAARIFQYLRFRPVPQRNYDSALYLVINPAKLVGAYLERAGVPGVLRPLGKAIGGTALSAYRAIRRRPFADLREGDFEVLLPDAIDGTFDALWERKMRERSVLLAERSREWLRWHFCMPGGEENISIVCAREGGRLMGYAVIRKELAAAGGLVRTRILDLLAEEDRPATIDRLLGGCHSAAVAGGSNLLEMAGFPWFVRARFLRWGAWSRQFPCWPYFYLAANPELARELEREDAWYACPYDGDAGL